MQPRTRDLPLPRSVRLSGGPARARGVNAWPGFDGLHEAFRDIDERYCPMEKGYRLMGAELEIGYNPAEAGVTLHGVEGADFVGKETCAEAIETLAERIPNTVVGFSRAAVNEGWRPYSDQVGQTGNKIAPELYIPWGQRCRPAYGRV